jgi:hypothetical protein
VDQQTLERIALAQQQKADFLDGWDMGFLDDMSSKLASGEALSISQENKLIDVLVNAGCLSRD